MDQRIRIRTKMSWIRNTGVYNFGKTVFFKVRFYNGNLCGRVSDPYSFFTDPDPEDPDGGQYGSGDGSGSNPDPGL
jgi:hypothetical protein